MKIRSIYLLAALLLFLPACEKNAEQVVDGVNQVQKLRTGFTVSTSAATRTAVDMSAGRIYWLTDDPVMVSNGLESITMYVLEGGNQRAELYSLDRQFSGNEFFAVYPALDASYQTGVFGSVIPSVQNYADGGFDTETFPMVASCGADRVLEFRNAASLLQIVPTGEAFKEDRVLSVTVTADENLAGPISVTYTPGQEPLVELDQEGGFNSITLNAPQEGIPFGEPIYVVVAPGEYHNMKVRIVLSGGLNYVHNVEETLLVERSRYKTISFEASDNSIDLSANGTANCYIITEPGSYRFRANVRGNGVPTSCGLEPELGAISRMSIYHSDGGNFIDGDITNGGNYVYFTTVSDPLPVGTVLVSAINGAGQTIWSWHIWCNPAVKDVTLSDGRSWLNMNLGAHHESFSEEGFNGYYYQWGRKDPFLQKNTGTATDKTSLAPFVSHASAFDGTLENSIRNPHIFYGGYTPKGAAGITADWSSYDDDLKYYDWWNADISEDDQKDVPTKKTMFDPCPPGYCVPSYQDVISLVQTLPAGEWKDGGKLLEGKLFFPKTSFRAIGINQGYWDDPRCFFWSSTPAVTGDRYHRTIHRPYFTVTGRGITAIHRSYGITVRCIKNAEAPGPGPGPDPNPDPDPDPENPELGGNTEPLDPDPDPWN
ncbi:MAG: hypothetical protein J6Y31_04810 [Bacteroidales bacterium]|nr:hypothetical protein [Bacteroidales bacterium]